MLSLNYHFLNKCEKSPKIFKKTCIVLHTVLLFDATRSIDLRNFSFVSDSGFFTSVSGELSLRIVGAINLTYAILVVGVSFESFGLHSKYEYE